MSSERHDRIAELLEEFALGQLGPEQQAEVDAHLRDCAACAQALREINEALALLAESAPAIQPPASLRARVLASVANERQEHAREHTTRTDSRRHHWPWLATAAALLLSIGLAFSLYRSESERQALSQDVQRATAEATNLRERLLRFSNQTDLALAILTAADMRELPLAGREDAAATAARAYWSPTRGLLVVADRLPTPPPGRVYQVWVIERGQPVSAGLLGDQAEGRGMLVAPPPRQGVGTAVTVAVTDEPPGGLVAPSGTIRLAGSI